MKKDKQRGKLQKRPKDTIIYPSNKNTLFYVTLTLSFIVSLIFYLSTLAPSVTFEDSGELITASYHLGIAHEPGYPLFTILGKLFTLIPFGSVAYRLNLMSAFFSSLATVLICFTTILLIENTFSKVRISQYGNSKAIQFLKYASGFSASIFFALSFENWEQSIITEVYGLHGFFIGLLIFLIIIWSRQGLENKKRQYFYLIVITTGLALTNHTTSLLFVPIILIYITIVDYKFLLNIKTILFGIFFGMIALLPLLYLPIASATDPVLDWGNPENLTNFIRTVSRHQYTDIEQNTDKFLSGMNFYFTGLLIYQWFPLVILLMVPAIFVLYKKNRNFFYFSLIFLTFHIPITTYLIDFEVTGDGFKAELYRLLVSVFYIPSYLFISILFGIAQYYCVSFIKKSSLIYLISALIILLPCITSIGNYRKVNMHHFNYTDIYLENLFTIISQDALVFAQVDYFYFPTMYYQYVEGQRNDVIILDYPLLKRSWYIDMLKAHQPALVTSASKEVEGFLKAVQPFENGEPYDGNFIEKNYVSMINSFIDNTYENGKDVFFTYIPGKKYLRDYNLESVMGAYRLIKNEPPLDINYGDFDLDYFKNVTSDDQLFVRYFSNYYGELSFYRALLMESAGKSDEAYNLYQYCLEFHLSNKRMRQFASEKVKSNK